MALPNLAGLSLHDAAAPKAVTGGGWDKLEERYARDGMNPFLDAPDAPKGIPDRGEGYVRIETYSREELEAMRRAEAHRVRNYMIAWWVQQALGPGPDSKYVETKRILRKVEKTFAHADLEFDKSERAFMNFFQKLRNDVEEAKQRSAEVRSEFESAVARGEGRYRAGSPSPSSAILSAILTPGSGEQTMAHWVLLYFMQNREQSADSDDDDLPIVLL